jgi:hypothetical protein
MDSNWIIGGSVEPRVVATARDLGDTMARVQSVNNRADDSASAARGVGDPYHNCWGPHHFPPSAF